MSKTNASSGNVLICLALAGVSILGFQVASLAQQQLCYTPSAMTKYCFTPVAPTVTVCNVATQQGCNNAHIYNIKKFPDGVTLSSSGQTTQEMNDCYQDTPCAWKLLPLPGACGNGTTLPTGTTYYQVAKTVNDPTVTCTTPKE